MYETYVGLRGFSRLTSIIYGMQRSKSIPLPSGNQSKKRTKVSGEINSKSTRYRRSGDG